MIIRRGYLTHYDECFFEIFSCWKACYSILYYDGTFEFYTNGKDSHFTNRIRLNKVFKYIAVGKICNMVPSRPDLPSDVPIDLMIGFPCVNSKNPSEMEYFHFSDQEDMILWMRAIDSVLPHNTETSLDSKLVRENMVNGDNKVETGTVNRHDPGYGKNTNYYYHNNPNYHYGYDPAIGAAAGLGLGMGLGVAMTMPMWAMSSAWCPPTIIHTGSPMLIDGTNTITVGNDITMPMGGDTVTTTVTTTDFNPGFDANFGNDFGTGFDF